MSSVRLWTRGDQRHDTQQTARIIAFSALAFLILGWCWALASPPGSAADDDFHLTSIWCAWGESESCHRTGDPARVEVPEYVVKAPCYALRFEQSGACVRTLTGEFVETDRVNQGSGAYPFAFYTAMRVFVGSDVNRSVIIMRMFNVGVAAALLAWALATSRLPARRGVASAWAVSLIPTGIFFIASTNPSSWVITGIGLFWAFFFTLLTQSSWRKWRTWSALTGSVMCAGLALGARSDSAVFLGVSIVAVLLMTWRRIHFRWIRVLSLVMPIVFFVGALPFAVGRYLQNPLVFPPAHLETDQPNPAVKTLLEFPNFFMALVGGQAPAWSQRSEAHNIYLEGYASAGYTYGVGWTDVFNPTISGVFAFACLSGIMFLGFRSYTRGKVAAVALVAVTLTVQALFMRAQWGWQGYQWLQPRYFIPFVFVLVGLAATTYLWRQPMLTRAQALFFVALLSLGQAASFVATMSRYTLSQIYAWSNLGTEPGWWWPKAPSITALIIISAIAGVAYFAGLTLVLRQVSASPSRPSVTPS